MASTYRDEDEGTGVISDINVTPLVDITLVLLIIFMVTAQLIVRRGIQVQTPKAATGREVSSRLVLTVEKDGDLRLNGEPYADRGALRAAISDRVAADPEIKAIIDADEEVAYGVAIGVIELVQRAGVSRFALAVEQPQQNDGP